MKKIFIGLFSVLLTVFLMFSSSLIYAEGLPEPDPDPASPILEPVVKDIKVENYGDIYALWGVVSNNNHFLVELYLDNEYFTTINSNTSKRMILQEFVNKPNENDTYTYTFRFRGNDGSDILVSDTVTASGEYGPSLDPNDHMPLTSTSKLGTVAFTVTGYNVLLAISYEQQLYYLNKSFSSDTDMSIFDTIEAYYQNIDGTSPQIIINHSNRPYLRDILEAPEDEQPTFVPHTIWDLNTNEITTVLNYKTNVFIKQNNAGVLISYVYIDEFVIDNILSAHLSWAHRFKHPWWYALFNGDYSPWEYQEEVLVSDKYLEYKNNTSNWEMYVPVWNIIRAIYNTTRTYEMPRIDNVNLLNPQAEYNITKTEVESHFYTVNKDFEGIKNNPRYKLWAFALQEGASIGGPVVGTLQSEIYHNPDDLSDPLNFKIINIVYETNGTLYEALGHDMDLRIVLDDPIDGIANEQPQKNTLLMIAFIGIAIIYVVVLSNNKGFKNLKNFMQTTLIFAGVILAIYLIYMNVFKAP